MCIFGPFLFFYLEFMLYLAFDGPAKFPIGFPTLFIPEIFKNVILFIIKLIFSSTFLFLFTLASPLLMVFLYYFLNGKAALFKQLKFLLLLLIGCTVFTVAPYGGLFGMYITSEMKRICNLSIDDYLHDDQLKDFMDQKEFIRMRGLACDYNTR